MSFTDSSIMPVLAVDDLERATAFYRDKLGFTVREDARIPDANIVRIGSKDYLLLYKTEFRRGDNTVASFLVDDVQAAVRELRDRGVKFEEYDLPGLKTEGGVADIGDAGKTAWFKDTEGNTLAIAADLEEYMGKAA